MAKRVAFLIGNQTFHPDSGLLPLQGPANDVTALARLLRDPGRGRFGEVQEFLDEPCHGILPELAQALGRATPGDFFLIYYSGHGKLDRQGRLCLATADTRQSALLATSILTRHLRDLVEESDCDQVVMLLDCCYSGAVEDGLRGDVDSALHAVEDARGFYILTASTGLQAARETEVAPGGAVMGRFTAALVSGIESGSADMGRKGKILLSDLRQHLSRTVKGQTPQFFDRKAIGDPLISFNPGTATPLLDPAMLADLDAEQWHRRRGAVAALASALHDGDAAEQAAARAALQRRLRQERDYTVRAEMEAVLGRKHAGTTGMSHPTTPPITPEGGTAPHGINLSPATVHTSSFSLKPKQTSKARTIPHGIHPHDSVQHTEATQTFRAAPSRTALIGVLLIATLLWVVFFTIIEVALPTTYALDVVVGVILVFTTPMAGLFAAFLPKMFSSRPFRTRHGPFQYVGWLASACIAVFVVLLSNQVRISVNTRDLSALLKFTSDEPPFLAPPMLAFSLSVAVLCDIKFLTRNTWTRRVLEGTICGGAVAIAFLALTFLLPFMGHTYPILEIESKLLFFSSVFLYGFAGGFVGPHLYRRAWDKDSL